MCIFPRYYWMISAIISAICMCIQGYVCIKLCIYFVFLCAYMYCQCQCIVRISFLFLCVCNWGLWVKRRTRYVNCLVYNTYSSLEMWIINGVKNTRTAEVIAASNSMLMRFYLTQAGIPCFTSAVELWTNFFSRPDRQTDRGQVVWGLLWVKTTASVYTPQIPQTCIHFYARQWAIPASGKCASVYFNSHTWCFGKCLQNMVGI